MSTFADAMLGRQTKPRVMVKPVGTITKTPSVKKVRLTTGENGMTINRTSGEKVLDFFAKSGAMRASTNAQILNAFRSAFMEDPLLAMRALFYARDARAGQGERRLFRTIVKDLADKHPEALKKNLDLVAKYGRWDDLTVLEGTELQQQVADLWIKAVRQKDALAAKWVPRKGNWFGILRHAAGLKAGDFRRWIAEQTKVVETQMCKNQWKKIDYSAVPSRASLIYRKAFQKHDQTRYDRFIAKAEKGEVKINSGVLFPSDLVTKVLYAKDATVEAQWKQLPNWLEEGSSGILPICDVSGSMIGEPMAVSVSLGIYLAERNKGKFHNLFMTFSDEPEFHSLANKASLYDKVQYVSHAPWGMSTDLEKSMETMLQYALKFKVPSKDMPQTLLIISDMQFNQCAEGESALTMMRRKFEHHGYAMPSVVFWNVRASIGQPAKATDKGTALVSGYSPSIMKSILAKKPQATPYEVMLETLNRYTDVQ